MINKLKIIAKSGVQFMKEVLSSDNDRPFPHVYSPFGIPADKFERTDKRVKVIIDPTPGYFVFQMRSDLKKYDKTLLIHGCETPDLNNIREVLIKHGHKFTKVYSFDKEVLNNVKGSELFCFGSCWVADGKKVYKNHFDLNKKFKLSFIRSSKRELPGHKLRYEIEGLFNKQYPFEVFFPKERVESKNVLFTDSMFHLTIENSRYENYFTEKVIDCFMSYTIPIYWGCPNIAGYFDQNGIIQFNTKEELETILKNLSPEDYLLREKAVKKNYDIAKAKYAFFFERIDEYIAKL